MVDQKDIITIWISDNILTPHSTYSVFQENNAGLVNGNNKEESFKKMRKHKSPELDDYSKFYQKVWSSFFMLALIYRYAISVESFCVKLQEG